MSDDLGDLGDSTEQIKKGPDYVAFYIQEIQKLLSSEKDFLPYSTPNVPVAATSTYIDEKDIFCNGKESSTASGSFSQGIGGGLPDYKKERLKALLKQSVVCFAQGVDDMLDPVIAIRQMQSQLRSRKSLENQSAAACEGDTREQPRKKTRLLSSLSSLASLSSSSSSSSCILAPLMAWVQGSLESDDEGDDAHLLEIGSVKGAKRCCDICHSTETTIHGPKGSKTLCNLCTLKSKQDNRPPSLSGDDRNTGSFRGSDVEANTEIKKMESDLQFLMENDTASVESSIKKYSDELAMTLEHMEQQLEELLDLLQSSNRLMNNTEKQQLQNLIQKLPPQNLDRVVEIIQKNRPVGKLSLDAIHVDLQKEDNVTLWRLYIYVKAVENARKLAG